MPRLQRKKEQAAAEEKGKCR